MSPAWNILSKRKITEVKETLQRGEKPFCGSFAVRFLGIVDKTTQNEYNSAKGNGKREEERWRNV